MQGADFSEGLRLLPGFSNETLNYRTITGSKDLKGKDTVPHKSMQGPSEYSKVLLTENSKTLLSRFAPENFTSFELYLFSRLFQSTIN